MCDLCRMSTVMRERDGGLYPRRSSGGITRVMRVHIFIKPQTASRRLKQTTQGGFRITGVQTSSAKHYVILSSYSPCISSHF